MNSFEKAVINAVFPTERPPTTGIQIGLLSLSVRECPHCGHSASKSFRPLKNTVGSVSPQLHFLCSIPYTPGVKFVCFTWHLGQM